MNDVKMFLLIISLVHFELELVILNLLFDGKSLRGIEFILFIFHRHYLPTFTTIAEKK